MSHGKQFTFYTHKMGPNGWYVPRPQRTQSRQPSAS